MACLSLLVLPLHVFTLAAVECYTYQSTPVFLSASDLAVLKGSSWDKTGKPTSPANGLRTPVDKPVRKLIFGGQEVEDAVVDCREDAVEVVAKVDLLGRDLSTELSHWRLGPIGVLEERCTAKASEHGEFTFTAPLDDCGTKLTLTQDSVIYSNLLLYTPLLATANVFETGGVAIPLLCKYKRRYSASSTALKPTWQPFIVTMSTHLQLDFHLKVMTDDWSDERRSLVYFLDDMVNIKASVDAANQIPLRLYANTCVATPTPDVSAGPRYLFLHQGCFTDAQLTGSNSRFLPRARDDALQIQLQPFLFRQDDTRSMYITCHLEVVAISQMDAGKRACSFIEGRWRSADGDDRACGICPLPSSNSSSTSRASRSVTRGPRNELQRDTTVGPLLVLPWMSP